MALPKWNGEWEKPDPLRGGRGWGRHHYATAGGAALLLVMAFGLLVPAVMKARHKEEELRRTYEQLRAAQAGEDPLGR